MKLSNLYTESSSQSKNPFKKLMGFAGKAFKKASNTPDAKLMRVQRALQEVYPEVWADYHEHPKAQARLETYKTGSFRQHYPELVRIQDPAQLKEQIRKLLKSRADRVLHQIQNPKAKYQGLGLQPDQIDRLAQGE